MLDYVSFRGVGGGKYFINLAKSMVIPAIMDQSMWGFLDGSKVGSLARSS